MFPHNTQSETKEEEVGGERQPHPSARGASEGGQGAELARAAMRQGAQEKRARRMERQVEEEGQIMSRHKRKLPLPPAPTIIPSSNDRVEPFITTKGQDQSSLVLKGQCQHCARQSHSHQFAPNSLVQGTGNVTTSPKRQRSWCFHLDRTVSQWCPGGGRGGHWARNRCTDSIFLEG